MGRNKVRMHHRTTDAQAVWKEYSEYMTTASKKIKVVNPNPHSTICNPEPKPSFVLDTPNPQSQPVHPLIFVLYLMTHLKMWINLISVILPAPPPI